MDTKEIFGLLASLFVVLGTIPYIVDIHFKQTKPHVLSWLGWAFITALGASAMMADGATWASAILWANTARCFIIAVYSIIKKVGVWSTGFYDYILFGLGIVGLILWQILDLPILALICAIAADLFFGLPTIIKTFKDPTSETKLVWLAAVISGVMGIFAVANYSFNEFAYPFYLFLYDTTMMFLVLRVMRQPKK